MAEARRKRGRSRWALTREQWLTWAEELPRSNSVVEGELWCDPDRAEVSIEKRFARQLDVGPGSTILLESAGRPHELVVTSIREIDWMTLELNFYVVVEPGVLDDVAVFRVAAACLPPEHEQAVQDRLNREHPGVTVFRLRPILSRVVEMMAGLALAERVLGGFTVLVGLAILAGAVSAAGIRRAREVALLKTLGATRRGVVVLLATEYGLTGLVAGLIGGFGAVILAWVYAEQVFGMDSGIDWIALPLSGLTAGLLAAICGVAASGRALTARPVESLRTT
jgi:putative ABC transport system permease protein